MSIAQLVDNDIDDKVVEKENKPLYENLPKKRSPRRVLIQKKMVYRYDSLDIIVDHEDPNALLAKCRYTYSEPVTSSKDLKEADESDESEEGEEQKRHRSIDAKKASQECLQCEQPAEASVSCQCLEQVSVKRPTTVLKKMLQYKK